MIDIHNHILAGIDDGAGNSGISFDMARIAVADGITDIVCTPHITPGLYDNDIDLIAGHLEALRAELRSQEIPLRLHIGADIHIAPDLARHLEGGHYPRLAGSRYFLFEPSHSMVQPAIEDLARSLLKSAFVPVLTHPERLGWIERHYDVICRLDEMGVAIQLTAGSITGRFGDSPRRWSERLLEEGRVDLIATDAHDARNRPPILSKARERVAQLLGDPAARQMTLDNPARILRNRPLPAKTRNPRRREGIRKALDLFLN